MFDCLRTKKVFVLNREIFCFVFDKKKRQMKGLMNNDDDVIIMIIIKTEVHLCVEVHLALGGAPGPFLRLDGAMG